MKDQDSWIFIGKFGRTHGIKGDILVYSFTDPPNNIQQYIPWYIYNNCKWQQINILQQKWHTRGLLVRVEGFETENEATLLSNREIAVPTSTLPTLDTSEYYWYELMGMEVINTRGDKFGKITTILSTGANDVLVVQGNSKHFIPYIWGRYVISISRDKALIIVDWDLEF